MAGLWTSLSLAAHAAPDARFTATPIQGDPCVAPCAVHFDAIGDGSSATTDPAFAREFHTLQFEWNFGDPGAGTWSVTGEDKNTALGAIAGHVYTQPGSYDVTLVVRNPAGETSTAEAEVEVADPDAVFSDSDTWCFANTGVPEGAGFEACPSALASRHVVIPADEAGGFESALGASFCNAGASKARCLFRAGDTFLATSFLVLAQTEAGPGLLSRFGAGANPRVTGGDGFLALGDGWTVANFDVELDPEAAVPDPLFSLFAQRGRVLVWDVRARGLRSYCFVSQTGFNAVVHSDLVGIVELDCRNESPSEQGGLFLRAERVLVLGNEIDEAYEGEFTFRSVHFPRSIIQHTRFERPQEDDGNQRNAIQIRAWAGLNSSGEPSPPEPSPTEWVIVSDNVISQDNAPGIIRTCQTNSCGDGATAPDLRDVIFERNFLFLTNGGTGGLGRMSRTFWLQGGDLTVRNNVVDLQGVDPTGTSEPVRLALQDPNEPSSTDLLDDRVHVLNNVIYFDEETERPFVFCTSLAGSDHECRNNLAWLPNQTGSQEADTGDFVSSHNVFADENPFMGPVPGQGLSSPVDFVPGPQSVDVIDSGFDYASGLSQVRRDFGARPRPADGDEDGNADWDVGAWEVSSDPTPTTTTTTTTSSTTTTTTTTTTSSTTSTAPTTTTSTTIPPLPSGKVLLCHKGRKSKLVKERASAGHFKHGDAPGFCPGDGAAVLCHKSKKTKLVFPKQLEKHLAHGDTLGACGGS